MFGSSERPCLSCRKTVHHHKSGKPAPHTCPHGKPCPPADAPCLECALARAEQK